MAGDVNHIAKEFTFNQDQEHCLDDKLEIEEIPEQENIEEEKVMGVDEQVNEKEHVLDKLLSTLLVKPGK